MQLGKLLVKRKIISNEEREKALALQKKCGDLLGKILVSEGVIKYKDLYPILAEQQALPFINLVHTPPNANLLKKEEIPHYIALECLPYAYDEGHIVIATTQITDTLKQWAASRYKEYSFVMTSPNDIRWTIEHQFGGYHCYLSREELHRQNPHFSAKRLSYWFLALFLPLLFVEHIGLYAIIAMNLVYLATFVFKGVIFTVGHRRGFDDTMNTEIDEASLPIYTVLVPLYKEEKSLPKLTENLRRLDYPNSKLDIKLIIEEDDLLTLETARGLNLECFFEIIKVPQSELRTKPRACNYALKFARGEYVTIYDAEDNPDPLQLKKAVLKFRESGAACIQARLNYYNAPHNLLTSLFSVEYAAWFEYMLQGLERMDFPIPLGGTSNHIRADVLRKVGAWDPYNVTEDADLGIRLEQAGYTTEMLHSETREEAPHTLVAWLKQRTRWIKGYMQTYLVHMRHPLRLLRNLGIRKFIGIQCFIGFPALMFLVTPFMLAFSVAWVTGLLSFDMPLWAFQLCVANFVLGVGIHWLFGMVVYLRSIPERRSIMATVVFPFYWILHSFAAFRAVYQLLTRPHYWDKTEHGFWQENEEKI